MIIKRDDKAVWVGLETPREMMLFSVAAGSITHIPNEAINDQLQKAANQADLDEISLVVDGIDAASAKEFAKKLVKRVLRAAPTEGGK